MKVAVTVTGLDAVRASLSGLEKQVKFASAKALTQTAHQVVRDEKDVLRAGIEGGPTPFTLRAFKVDAAKRDNLTATISLRDDKQEGGNSYTAVLGHLYTGGNRRWKKLEGWLRARNIVPNGMMIAPGAAAPLDQRGNFRAAHLKEMLSILGSNVRNLQEWRKSGKGGQFKAIGFFVARPGDKSGRTPGIWRRITTGKTSAVEPWIMFISPTPYRQRFDLHKTATRTVAKVFQTNYQKALQDALRSAK